MRRKILLSFLIGIVLFGGIQNGKVLADTCSSNAYVSGSTLTVVALRCTPNNFYAVQVVGSNGLVIHSYDQSATSDSFGNFSLTETLANGNYTVEIFNTVSDPLLAKPIYSNNVVAGPSNGGSSGGSNAVGGNTSSDITCGTNGTSINTAIGCIPFGDQNALIGFILKWAIGIGGGIAFLLILIAGFQIMTSRGDPNRLKAGQELLTSAIAGLLLLIFSIIILRIIGVDILGIKALIGG